MRELDTPRNISASPNDFATTGHEGEDNTTDVKRRDNTKNKDQHNQPETYMDASTQNNAMVDQRFAQLEEMIRRIPGVPAPVKKSSANSFADSPFVDAISMVEIPRKFNLPAMRMYDGTTDPDDHVAQYK